MAGDSPDVSIRPMSAEEFERFRARSYADYVEELRESGLDEAAATEKSDADFARFLPDGVHSEGQHLYVIVDPDGTVIGDLWLGLAQKGSDLEAFGYDFWVRPDLRDRGIGRRVIELGEQAARELGATRLALNVFGPNDRARHLYESAGFEVTSMNMAKRLDP